MELLERNPVLHLLGELLAGSTRGEGRVALVGGEAGIGKTSVLNAFVDLHHDTAHILWGGCDDLLSARPLGPVWDMAGQEPDLNRALRTADRHEVFSTLLDLLGRSLRPTVMVVEDVHWADDSTLDMIKFLGRRIGDTHGLLILSFRDDAVHGEHQLRLALGDLPAAAIERITLTPLSREAVKQLAGGRPTAEIIWEASQGNPFFVTEMIAAGRDRVPASIRDAIKARLLRLSFRARSLAELVSVIPGRAEISLVASLIEDFEVAAAECENAGILEVHGVFIGYRHELARRGVEGDLTEIRRRTLNRDVLAACEREKLDLARCSHHAREAGDADAIVRLVPIAAQRAANLESHREALQQLRALEPYLDLLSPLQLARHYDLWANEEYIAATEFAHPLIGTAVEQWRQLDDPAALGNSMLMASRIHWVDGRRASAVKFASEAASVLEPVGGEELAFAYSTLSQLAMLASDEEQTARYAEKAMAVAGPTPSRARAHALNNLGAVKMSTRYPEGMAEIEESYRMNAELGLSGDQTRAAVNIIWSALESRDLPTAELWLERGLAIARDRELPTFESYLLSEEAILAVQRGEWERATDIASGVLSGRLRLEVSRTVAAMVLGRIQIRQGARHAKDTALDAWHRAKMAGELQRLGPAASVLAEYLWLAGDLEEDLVGEVFDVMEQCLRSRLLWYAGDIAIWLWLNGSIDKVPQKSPEPYLHLANADWNLAAEFWQRCGIPYERAVALGQGNNETKIDALRILDGLGAVPHAARIRTELQASGVAGIPRGPQRATKESPLGLTPRQTDVLALVAEGLTNAEIADNLFVSNRTVDHHVAAILSKLNVSSRVDAVTAARNAGLVN